MGHLIVLGVANVAQLLGRLPPLMTLWDISILASYDTKYNKINKLDPREEIILSNGRYRNQIARLPQAL